jgi:hypothetical protein
MFFNHIFKGEIMSSAYGKGVALGRAINKGLYSESRFDKRVDMKIDNKQGLPFGKTLSFQEENERREEKKEAQERRNVLITLYGQKDYKKHEKDYDFGAPDRWV